MNLSHFIIVFAVICCWQRSAAAQPRNVRICIPGSSPAFTYLNVAQDRGYFAQEKLLVEILTARGQLCITALLGEQISFTTNPSAFDLMVEGKIKGKVLYNAAKGLAHKLIVSPEIKSYVDLRGKTMAIAGFGGFADKLTREILAQHGLQAMRDVMLLQIGTADVRYLSLRTNKVQGTVLVGQYATTAIEEGMRELDYESPPYITGPLSTLDSTLARDRPMVSAFVRAVMKGHLFFRDNLEQTIAIMQKALRVENAKLAAQLHKDEVRRYNAGGRFDDAYLRRLIDRARQDNGVKREIDIKELFDSGIAREVEEELKRTQWVP
jgi:ABC-type nitrate/sulfonate/bicarbonate transport system substrate-binding protein